MASRNPLVKIGLALAGVALLAFLFVATLRDVASEPYTVRFADLRQWTVAVSAGTNTDALLLLRPPRALPMGLFDQVFQRTMASYSTPVDPGIPLVLRREFDEMAQLVSVDELVALAQESGLETDALQARCMSVYRTTVGREQQHFFVLFDFPPFGRFRDQVAQLVLQRGGGGGFDPDSLSPALLVASSESSRLDQVPPQSVLEQACESPIDAG